MIDIHIQNSHVELINMYILSLLLCAQSPTLPTHTQGEKRAPAQDHQDLGLIGITLGSVCQAPLYKLHPFLDCKT